MGKRAYVAMGVVALLALAVIYATTSHSFSLGERVLFFMLVAAIMLWAYRGVVMAEERERQEALQKEQAAEEARRAEQEAAFQEQLAHRTSLGGRTIAIRRRGEHSDGEADTFGS